jgi:hypothetical protein
MICEELEANGYFRFSQSEIRSGAVILPVFVLWIVLNEIINTIQKIWTRLNNKIEYIT